MAFSSYLGFYTRSLRELFNLIYAYTDLRHHGESITVDIVASTLCGGGARRAAQTTGRVRTKAAMRISTVAKKGGCRSYPLEIVDRKVFVADFGNNQIQQWRPNVNK